MVAYHRQQYQHLIYLVIVKAPSASGFELTINIAPFSAAIFLISAKSSIEPKKFGY